MKKLALFLSLGCFISTFAADGAMLYKKCIACHGAKAEKVYLNKVPALKSLSSAQRLEYMKAYIAGTRNVYGQGAIMKLNLKGLSDEDLKAIDTYISTLK